MEVIQIESGKDSITDDFMYGNNVATSHIQVRMGFLRKVYGILSIQLLVTAVTAALFMSSTTIKSYVQQSSGFLMLAGILSLVLIIALMVKRHESPTNMYLLFAFTFVDAYSVGTIVTFYDVDVVIQAVILTSAVTVALTMYTFQSKRDFSSWGAGLFSVLLVLIVASIMQLFLQSEVMNLMIAIGGAVIFSLFLIYDTHLLMHKLSPEEYILASINLYLDIINLFLYILRILNEAKKR
ncbi:protein lifeguard 4-like [Anneissia japonica]|uniref:protein lifeguard 4-like n=1 Tax=Anneissia japonica TaxID=1529436 RepID=UPI00142595AB|nr:protein lifeguard 4-like [Anneissia japonica]XP_033095810.1 protein lifeguard 4-like [Anneissia japonica]XP_033095812.1 protein lifeguard 4-like [Anneissia japonica]